MGSGVPWPDPWVTIAVIVVCLLLLGIVGRAETLYKVGAGCWLSKHEEWLQKFSKTWQAGTEWPQLGPELPTPLGDRISLLMSAGRTSLAEGDLGRFLLRRPEVKGQYAIGASANLLISLALASTILGLIVTLFGLATSQKELRSAVSHFPWFFIPTCLGVLLGAWANLRQSSIDSEFELLWDRLDTFTITHLLPQHVKPKSALEETTQKLADAAGLFESSGKRLEGTIGQLESAAVKLSELDPTQWAVGLKDTSEKFVSATQSYETHVGTLGNAVGGFKQMLGQQEQLISGNGRLVSEVGEMLQKALFYKDELVAVLSGFKDSLQTVQSLKDEIEQFSSDVKGLSGSVLTWSQAQDNAASKLGQEVGRIAGTLEPALEKWSQASGFFKDNHTVLKENLDNVVEQLELLHGKLAQSQSRQVEALGQIFDGFEKRTAQYWSSASVELSERFDHAPDVLQELQKVVASLEGARALGSELPNLSQKLGGTTEQLAMTLSRLEQRNEEVQAALLSAVNDGHQQLLAGIDHWATQQRAHQETLTQWGSRLQESSELPFETDLQERATASDPSFSSRTILGLPLGPPPWMIRLLKKFSKEARP